MAQQRFLFAATTRRLSGAVTLACVCERCLTCFYDIWGRTGSIVAHVAPPNGRSVPPTPERRTARSSSGASSTVPRHCLSDRGDFGAAFWAWAGQNTPLVGAGYPHSPSLGSGGAARRPRRNSQHIVRRRKKSVPTTENLPRAVTIHPLAQSTCRTRWAWPRPPPPLPCLASSRRSCARPR